MGRERQTRHVSQPPPIRYETAAPTDDQLVLALDTVRSADRFSLKQIYRTLPAPDLDHFFGEFDAELLDQGNWLVTQVVSHSFSLRGHWIGKAFQTDKEERGNGYNCFLKKGTIQRGLEMDTRVGESLLDGGPALLIEYRSRHGGLIGWLDGEVRELALGVWLGMGIFGPRMRTVRGLRRVIPFALLGPTRPFQQ